MDRLETKRTKIAFGGRGGFTFQYGQIRNIFDDVFKVIVDKIYIPVWIDQKPY